MCSLRSQRTALLFDNTFRFFSLYLPDRVCIQDCLGSSTLQMTCSLAILSQLDRGFSSPWQLLHYYERPNIPLTIKENNWNELTWPCRQLECLVLLTSWATLFKHRSAHCKSKSQTIHSWILARKALILNIWSSVYSEYAPLLVPARCFPRYEAACKSIFCWENFRAHTSLVSIFKNIRI